jgi:membrane associated rhomboid family serine protease
VLSLLFGGYMIWSVGQQLSYTWSERRFVARIAAWTLGAGAGTVLLAQVWDWASLPHIGIWPIALAMLVAWAMVFPDQQTSFWGVLPMTGRTLALIAAGLTVLSGLMNGGVRGIGTVTPHLLAMGIAWAQSRPGVGGGRSWRQAKRWWADREAKRRSRHLKVVKKNGSDGRSDWLN